MTVEIDLQTKRAPRGNTDVDKTEHGVDKVEIVVQALARIVFEESLVRFFVMPWFV